MRSARSGSSGDGEPGTWPRRSAPPGWARHAIAVCSAASAAAARIRTGHPDPGERPGELVGRIGTAGHRGHHPVAPDADAGLQSAHELAGADEFLPAGQHLAVQQFAVADAMGHLGVRRVERPPGRTGQRPGRRDLMVGRHGQLGQAGAEREDGPVHGLAHDGGAGRGRRGQRPEPVAQGGHLRLGQQTARIEPRLGQHEQPGRAESVLGHHLGQVRGDLVGRRSGYPVQHEGDRGAALAGGPQHLPGHGIGVAGGGGDEQPEVSGRQQLFGQYPVGLHHGVDVRRVEQGEPRAERRYRYHPQHGAAGVGTVGATEPGQQVGLGEPGRVGGVTHQYRGPGGRSQDAGRADRVPHQTVHQGRLTGPGGTADDHEQRRVEPGEAGKQIVIELADDRRGGPGSAIGVREGQRKGDVNH